MSKLEEDLAAQLDAEGIRYEREVCVIPGRKFRFDFDIIGERLEDGHQLLVEVQGGTFIKGAHSTGTGIARDCEKAILAQLQGYRIFPVTSVHIKNGQALGWIKEAIG